ncbi:hypothetical protein ACSRBG_25075, partial [Salmonella enterica]
IRETHPGHVMNKLPRLFTRARPETQESNILRGILASIDQQNKGKQPHQYRTERYIPH